MSEMPKEKIIVSSCLLGCKCRYNGTDCFDKKVACLEEKYQLVLACPEVLAGLPTPRPPVEISYGKAIDKNGNDKTLEFQEGAQKTLQISKENNISKAVLKSKSPSCGPCGIYDGTFSGTLTSGQGFTARLLIENGVFVISEKDIDQLL